MPTEIWKAENLIIYSRLLLLFNKSNIDMEERKNQTA